MPPDFRNYKGCFTKIDFVHRFFRANKFKRRQISSSKKGCFVKKILFVEFFRIPLKSCTPVKEKALESSMKTERPPFKLAKKSVLDIIMKTENTQQHPS